MNNFSERRIDLKDVAKQHLSHRRFEASELEKHDFKDGRAYIREFFGLRELFNYVKTRPQKTILDVGAGVTKAISQLAESELGNGIEFSATVLRRNPRIRDFLGYERTFITSVESLKQIKDGSMGGVLACHSVSYSRSPELAVKQLDRVLCAGGVFKGVYADNKRDILGNLEYPPDRFAAEFRSRGYDIYINGPFLLAIKGGGEVAASELFSKDLESYHNQEDILPASDYA